MEYRTLEITLQSGKDLNKVNLITKMDVYAVVTISGEQKTKSPVDHDGDANPTWNYAMKFTVEETALQMNRLTLDFKLICERALGDKDVGEVSVPLRELLDSPPKTAAEAKQIVSYQVRKPSGKPKGQLSFSYKFSDKTLSDPPYAAAAPAGKADSHPPPYGAYPPPTGAYPPPTGAYPPPSGYPPIDGNSHYPQPPAVPAAYSAVEGSSYYPPPAVSGSGSYPPAGYPAVDGGPKPGAYPPPPPPTSYGYPPAPPHGYGYPPPHGYPGYGYPPPPPPVQQPPKKNKFGMGLGAGLLGGAIGGLLIGDAISDVGDYDFGGFDC